MNIIQNAILTLYLEGRNNNLYLKKNRNGLNHFFPVIEFRNENNNELKILLLHRYIALSLHFCTTYTSYFVVILKFITTENQLYICVSFTKLA